MKNAVGREIPDYLLTEGREVYQGKNYMDGKYIQKASPRTRRYEKPQESKLVDSLAQALRQCGARSGMTFSFHHHLRDGDYVVNLVMAAAIEELGLKDLTIAATSLGSAHDPIADYIEQGKVVGIQTSGIRGRMGEVVSAGKLKTPAVIRSHGGRPRAIEAGEVHIDIAFVAAPTSDCVGNCRGVGGKSDCGSLGYAMTDAKYADHVVVVTDCLVDFPNFPASVEAIDVDAVVVVDSISKRFSACGARVGILVSRNRELMAQALKICQGRLCAATLDQLGAAALYGVGSDYFSAVREEYHRRRDTCMEGLSQIPGVVCECPKGAFYLMAKLPVDDTDKFQTWLLEEFQDNGETVMFAPGEGFYGTPGKGRDEVRLAYILKQADLRRAMEVLAHGIEAYNSRKL